MRKPPHSVVQENGEKQGNDRFERNRPHGEQQRILDVTEIVLTGREDRPEVLQSDEIHLGSVAVPIREGISNPHKPGHNHKHNI